MKRLFVALLVVGALSQGTFAALTSVPQEGQCTFIQSNNENVLYFSINVSNEVKCFYIPLNDSKYTTFLQLLIASRTNGFWIGGGYEPTDYRDVGGHRYYRMVYLQMN